MRKVFLPIFLVVCYLSPVLAHKSDRPAKGNLFIIGGGKRSQELMQSMLATAQLTPKDYIVVLPMSSAEPDSAYYYFKISVDKLCTNAIANLDFTPEKVHDKVWLDSLRHAKLIFIAGGDQSRFMQSVLNTPVYTEIHNAYENGATIAGTSAGAAVMSKFMITGKELVGDTSYNASFTKLRANNLDLRPGLGLVDSAIVDQHFIVRSRYNRLLSALARFPAFPCIGIDEATAIIIRGDKATVAGDSQVIVFRNPKGLRVTDKGLIKFSDLQMSVYTAGDSFRCK